MIFPAIDFQYNMDLLDFYAEGKSDYVVCLETKNYTIQFPLSSIKSLN